MKSFIKYFANSKIGILLRNSLKIAPVNIKTYNNNKTVTVVSDVFLWRTDNGFETRFKFSDILNLFYEVKNSWVEIHFYTKHNKLIKIEKIDSLDHVNEINITSEYLGNINSFGNFYIFHYCPKKCEVLRDSNILTNRCYVGYSKNNNLHSFVHGNAYAKFTSVYNNESIKSDIVRTSLLKNSEYTIQKYFYNFDKNEIVISNPTSKTIKFSLNNNNYKLKPACTTILNIDQPIVRIKSTCMFLRPTVFSYKDQYIDVHHS